MTKYWLWSLNQEISKNFQIIYCLKNSEVLKIAFSFEYSFKIRCPVKKILILIKVTIKSLSLFWKISFGPPFDILFSRTESDLIWQPYWYLALSLKWEDCMSLYFWMSFTQKIFRRVKNSNHIAKWGFDNKSTHSNDLLLIIFFF
jgi:hypothetical protein